MKEFTNPFFSSVHCESRVHCKSCRGNRNFREKIATSFGLPVDFDCPFGITNKDFPSTGLGDTVEKVIDKVSFGKIKTCGGCQKRRESLNKIFPYKEEENG